MKITYQGNLLFTEWDYDVTRQVSPNDNKIIIQFESAYTRVKSNSHRTRTDITTELEVDGEVIKKDQCSYIQSGIDGPPHLWVNMTNINRQPGYVTSGWGSLFLLVVGFFHFQVISGGSWPKHRTRCPSARPHFFRPILLNLDVGRSRWVMHDHQFFQDSSSS